MEGDPLPEIEADPRALKQVMLNLMSNAVKFTPENGQVVVRTFDAADGVVMQVADSGIGISEEDLPRVGRPFEQIENQHAKKHQGSGLGLALSKSPDRDAWRHAAHRFRARQTARRCPSP